MLKEQEPRQQRLLFNIKMKNTNRPAKVNRTNHVLSCYCRVLGLLTSVMVASTQSNMVEQPQKNTWTLLKTK